ncbi:Nn.00g117710.m01.CDS01 [Neocucurbitaria sp. VM-36]
MTLRKAPLRLTNWNPLVSRNLRSSTIPSYSYVFASSQASKENIEESNREIFEYMSGRWIYNESRRLAERHLAFNIDELKKAAAKAVNRPTSDITSFRKMAEGGFNRVFDMSMKDGSSILARLPYPSTLPRHLAVASEVATLDFARAHGIPTPRVLGYSADDNAVGSEYILMEKLPGSPLRDAWFDLSEQQRLKVLLQIVELEAKLFETDLPASGSIYYSRDLSSGTPKVDIPGSDDGLCIGPYAALRWWIGERGDLDVDRGPHDNPRLVLQAPAEKELAWIQAYGRSRYPFERAYRETFGYKRQDPEEHAKSLKDYIRLAPHLVPTCSKLNRPLLRHPDLNPNNIFVSEDLKITGLIDWQHSLVLPTFLAAGIPNVFQNYKDEESLSFAPPRVPDDPGSMNEDNRAIAYENFRRRHIHFFYLRFTQKMNEPHWRALEQETGLLKRRIFEDAGSPWEGLSVPLQYDIARVSQNWSKIASANPDGTIPACPIMLSEQEAQRRAALDDSLCEVDSEMERINGVLGIASDGWTPNESYDSAKERAKFIREEGLAAVGDDPWLTEMTEQHWPFDDCNEDE